MVLVTLDFCLEILFRFVMLLHIRRISTLPTKNINLDLIKFRHWLLPIPLPILFSSTFSMLAFQLMKAQG